MSEFAFAETCISQSKDVMTYHTAIQVHSQGLMLSRNSLLKCKTDY